MMFKQKFHAGIVAGDITCTFRYWKRTQVVAGNFYKINPIGRIEVHKITTIKPDDLTQANAKASGFDSVAQLFAYISSFDTDQRTLYRIEFSFAGRRDDLDPEQETVTTDQALDTLKQALQLRDKNSATGPWTLDTLKLVGKHPGMSSAVMAKRLNKDRVKLKQDMRKLKQLGLTSSLETGYELTDKGRSAVHLLT